ncbi:FAD-dependent oxidoreductase [Brevundimonas sp.]|uniref:NAD(P)/FAD-dependent oxidoreductase n=1 Tax=Brevundimonas sp. TaxID=1871086 RepID=UPI002BA27D28|nr:FAD-dependent oxidoreductase [Brevundimonas sp.]HWQ85339.1 FAD-dependent oxidoreductase [Brevundimonas sp.]
MHSVRGRPIWSPVTSSPDVIVIGAGVLGLCSAAELGARGHAVTVVDPGGPNASSAAAGMIAPALESLSDDSTPERAALLRRARDRWPGFAEAFGLALHRDGVDWRGPDIPASVTRLVAMGFAASPTPTGLTSPDDWRVDVAGALKALARAPGVTVIRSSVARLSADARRWRVEAEDGRTWFAPTVVLATGVAAPLPGLPRRAAAAVALVEPFRGQLTPVAAPAPPQTLRTPELYIVPTTSGVVIGATMERGRRDIEPDLAESASRVAAGLALLGVEGEAGPPRVGVRGASPDGLPLAGPAGEPGLHLALAPFRNGWLMGPLVAQVVADGIEGRASMADAAALDPLRFA